MATNYTEFLEILKNDLTLLKLKKDIESTLLLSRVPMTNDFFREEIYPKINAYTDRVKLLQIQHGVFEIKV
jgi:hypothetical protein